MHGCSTWVVSPYSTYPVVYSALCSVQHANSMLLILYIYRSRFFMLDMHLQDPLLLVYSSPVDRWTKGLQSLRGEYFSVFCTHLADSHSERLKTKLAEFSLAA